MKRLQRYVLSRTALTTLVLLLILLAVAMSTLLADALAQVVRGRISPDQLLAMMGLNTLEALKQLLPLGVFLGMVLSLTRLAQDNELVVMQASGFRPGQMLAVLAWLASPLLVLQLVLGLWLVPWADRMSDQLVLDARTRLGLSSLQPGHFRSLPDGGVIYVEEVDPQARQFRGAFLYRVRDGEEWLVTAREGIEHSSHAVREIVLEQGWQTSGRPDELAWTRVHFEQNRLLLPQEQTATRATELENVPLTSLFARNDRQARTEIRARLSPAWSVFVLSLMVMPLARLSPRTGRYGRIAVALLIYVLYGNLVNIARIWYEQGLSPAWLGMEWIHILLMVLAWIWWLQGNPARMRLKGRWKSRHAQA